MTRVDFGLICAGLRLLTDELRSLREEMAPIHFHHLDEALHILSVLQEFEQPYRHLERENDLSECLGGLSLELTRKLQ